MTNSRPIDPVPLTPAFFASAMPIVGWVEARNPASSEASHSPRLRRHDLVRKGKEAASLRLLEVPGDGSRGLSIVGFDDI